MTSVHDRFPVMIIKLDRSIDKICDKFFKCWRFLVLRFIWLMDSILIYDVPSILLMKPQGNYLIGCMSIREGFVWVWGSSPRLEKLYIFFNEHIPTVQRQNQTISFQSGLRTVFHTVYQVICFSFTFYEQASSQRIYSYD